MSRIWNVIALMTVSHQLCDGANILVWSPRISYSHVHFLGKIADILQEDGHNVTLFEMETDPEVEITGSKLVKNVIVYANKHFNKTEWRNMDFIKGNVWSSQILTPHDRQLFGNFSIRKCRGLIEDTNMLNTLRSSNFTLAVVEPLDLCPARIFGLIGIESTILVSAMNINPIMHAVTGLPRPPSHVPVFQSPFSEVMSFWERFENMRLLRVEMNFLIHEDLFFDALFGSHAQSPLDFYKERTAFILLNTHEYTDYARITMQKIKQIGGAAYQHPRSIQEPYLSLFKQAKKGVILFSLGSLVKSSDIPMSTKRGILNAFSHFPDHEFIWKYEEVDDANKMFANYSNVHFFKWIPQNDLLGNNNTRVFITHAGLNSMTEATLNGVPVITIPILFDQHHNAHVAERKGYAYRIAKDNISEASLVDGIRAVLGEDGQHSEYTKTAEIVKRRLRGHVEEVRETIKKCAKEAIEFGTLEHLNLPGRDYSVVRYYNVDVILVACLMLLVALIVLVGSLCAIIRCLLFKSNKWYGQNSKKRE